MKYALTAVASMIAVGVTGGLVVPWRNTMLYGYRIRNTWFGDRRFRFDGSAAKLMGLRIVCGHLILCASSAERD